MKNSVLCILLIASALTGAYSVFTHSPKRMIFGWLGVGLFQSAFFIVIGFEFLGILNALFTVGSATILQLYSALFGTRDTHEAERSTSRSTWVGALGTVITLGTVLGYAFTEVPAVEKLSDDLATPQFTAYVLDHFPELPWILGMILFLVIVAAATVGRPAWKKLKGGLT